VIRHHSYNGYLTMVTRSAGAMPGPWTCARCRWRHTSVDESSMDLLTSLVGLRRLALSEGERRMALKCGREFWWCCSPWCLSRSSGPQCIAYGVAFLADQG